MNNIIHIPSSMMTALPSYNLIVDNKIDNVNYSYDNISLSNSPLWSFTLTKNEGETFQSMVIDAKTINADLAQKTKLDSDALGKDIYGVILRKQVSINSNIVSLNYYKHSSGADNIDNICIKSTDGSLSYVSTIKPETSIKFGNLSGFKLSNYIPETDIEIPHIDIDVSTLKYNFIDIVLYVPIEIVFSILKDKNSVTIDVIAQYAESSQDNLIIKGSMYMIEQNKVENEGFALNPNELYQQQTVYNSSKPIVEHITENILTKWSNGRQTMSLTCVYGEYRDYETGDIAINGIDGRMVDVGDIVVPTRLYTDTKTNTNSELPIAVDKNGNAIQFEVLSSEIEFSNGKLVTHLKLMEVK